MSEYDRTNRSHGDHERNRESGDRNRANMSSSNRHDDRNRYDNRNPNDRNVWSRSVDEVRSWFGDDEAEHRRLRDEEERMRQDQIGAYHNHTYLNERDDRRSTDSSRDAQRSNEQRGWDGSRGYGSNIERDYGRNDQRTSRTDRDRSDSRHFGSSNNYGGPRERDNSRDYPTNNSGRSSQNNEDDQMKHGYESQSDYHRSNSSESARLFGGRDFERNYPTRAERNHDPHRHDHSEGGQSHDSDRGYRSLNNTGRTGIGQDIHLGKERDSNPKPQDKNYSHGDYTPNLNAGGQEYYSRHYEQRGRLGSAINEYAQQGYSQGYGRSGYSLDQSGNAAQAEGASTKHPKNYKGADDRIYVEVCEALGRELDASGIEVTSAGNEITLTGSVRSRDEKRRAARIAEGVRGVEDVHNQLIVKADATASNSSIDSSPSPSRSNEGNSADGANGSGHSASSNGSGRASSRQ